jgi:hypothetical protein
MHICFTHHDHAIVDNQGESEAPIWVGTFTFLNKTSLVGFPPRDDNMHIKLFIPFNSLFVGIKKNQNLRSE